MATYKDCIHFVVCDRCPNCKPNECEFFTNKADVEEVKHGYWIYHPDDLFPAESEQECSICHEREDLTLVNENYCPNCGAKMDGERKEDKK